MARSNYSFNKRQKELARKKKKEQKKQRKLDKNNIESEENPSQSQNEERIYKYRNRMKRRKICVKNM